MNSQTYEVRWLSFGLAVNPFSMSKATVCRLAISCMLFVCALPLTAMAGPVAIFKGSFSRIEDRPTDSRRIAGGCFIVFDLEAKTHTEIIFYERAGKKLFEEDAFTQHTFTLTGPEDRRRITFAYSRSALGPGDLRRAYTEIGGIQKQLAISGSQRKEKAATVVFPRTLTGIQLQNFPDASGDLHVRQELIVTVQSELTELANKAGQSEEEVVANLEEQLKARGYVQD